ncbi:hypothetical protein L1049_002026 [Liquidambar formosana]|uniref:Transmembrane protein n=1 Tax=Liquidambar formosana TaxID=63359 RepID=A0AAP0R8M0_LIQFO
MATARTATVRLWTKNFKKMKMENNQIMMKEKLGFFGILKEALTIPCKNPKFIILTFLTSLPLFCAMLIHETIFQQTLIETAKISTQKPFCDQFFCYNMQPMDVIKQLIEVVSHRFLLLGLLYLGMVHLLDLLNTIKTINSASVIYAGEKSMNLKDMLYRPIKEATFGGPLITSLYALLLASLTLLGLVSLATQFYTSSKNILFMVVFGVLFIALLTKYLEWTAIWNMGLVISILEGKHGDVALGVSAYLSRGSRRRGLFLVLVFFVWRLALRVSCLYVGWHEGGSGIVVTATQVCLVCLENVIKWVVFMIYFYDCKKRFLEKKVDVEDGRAAENVK